MPKHNRSAAAIDFFVLLLAAVALLFWILGQLVLAYFPIPVGASSIGADQKIVSSKKLDDDSSNEPDSESPSAIEPDSSAKKSPGDLSNNQTSENVESQGNEEDSSEQILALNQKLADVQQDHADIQRAFDNYKTESNTKLNEAIAAANRPDAKAVETITELQRKLGLTEQSLQQEIEKNNQLLSLQSEQNQFSNPAANALQLNSGLAENGKDNSNSAQQLQPVFRSWSGINGRKIDMAFIRRNEDGKLVFIGRDNQLYILPITSLITEDQKLIESTLK